MNITCADGDTYNTLFNTGLNDYLVEVELHDGRLISGYVTDPDQTTLGLRWAFWPSTAQRIEYDDVKALVVL